MTTIKVPHNFVPRPYQIDAYDALEKGYRRIDLVWHRRAGKDKVSFCMLAKEAAKKAGLYLYIFPTARQGRTALWKNMDNDGFETLKHIHPNIVSTVNNTYMELTLWNGSIIKIVGSKNMDRIVGTNPLGIVFSEWSLQDPKIYQMLNPILEFNKGFAIFNYTPRGNNHAYDFHRHAMSDPKWFSSTVTAKDTNILSEEVLEQIKKDVIMQTGTDAIFYQEYFCSFDTPVQGSVFGDLMQQAYLEKRVTKIAYNPELLVHTAWDLGVGDPTCIWFFQVKGNSVFVIDYYETFNAGLKHFADILKEKDYSYGTHFLPHDAGHNRHSSGDSAETIQTMLRNLGVYSTVVLPVVPKTLQLEKARNVLRRSYFNENLERGLLALKEYSFKWSDKNKAMSKLPAHDWASHPADAFQYLAQALEQVEAFDFKRTVKPSYSYSWR